MMRYLLIPAVALGAAGACINSLFGIRRIPSGQKLYREKKEILRIPYRGKEIYGELLSPETGKPKALIIACHGFDGSLLYFKNALGYKLAQEGYALYAFDFINGSRHSKSGGSIRDMSAVDEKDQLLAVYDYFKERYENIILAGESQGGLIATLANAELQDIRALILYYPAYCAIPDARKRLAAGETKHFGIDFRSDYTEELAGIDLSGCIRGISVPAILIHGDSDKAVDVSYAYKAKELCPQIELHILPGKDHGLDHAGRTEAAEYVGYFLKNIV